MKPALVLFFAVLFLLLIPVYVEAAVTSLYFNSTATGGSCPTTSKKMYTSVSGSLVTTWPGEFDSGFPGGADAGQFMPGSADVANLTTSVEIAKTTETSRTSASFGQGWLYDEDLAGSTIETGNFTFYLQIAGGQMIATAAAERIFARASIVTCSVGSFVFVKDLFTTNCVGAVSCTGGQAGWRANEDARIDHPAVNAIASVVVNVTASSSHTFASGEMLLIEIGFGDASGTADRTIGLRYNTVNSYVVTPTISPPNPPQWSANATKISSPAEYDTANNYGFQINWTDADGNFANASFQLGRPGGTLTNYTISTTPATNNNSAAGPNVWYINLTQDQLGGVGTYNYTWFGIDTGGLQNKSDTVNYVINQAATSMRLFLNGTENNNTYSQNDVANFTAFLNISKTITLRSNYTGFVDQTGTQTIFNYTTLGTLGNFFNLTAFWSGDENYTASQKDYLFDVTAVATDSTFSIAFPISYSGSFNESITANITAANFISFNFSERPSIAENWVQPNTGGSFSNNQSGSTRPIILFYNTGNVNEYVLLNMTAPTGIQVCANSTCAGADCSGLPTYCANIGHGVFASMGIVNQAKQMNITLYANKTGSASAGISSNQLYVKSNSTA